MDPRKVIFSTLSFYLVSWFLVVFGIWHPKTLAEILAGYLIGILIIAYGLFFVFQDEQFDGFDTWLFQNRQKIMSGQAEYKGVPISPDTEFFQYAAPLSIFFHHTTLSSGPYFKQSGGFDRLRALAVFQCTWLLFGWWRIPGGLRQTFQALSSNGKGGAFQTVLSRIEMISAGGKVFSWY